MKIQNQKVILVTVFHSFVSKNILNIDAFIALRNSGEYKIVLLVPEIKKDFFERYYGNENTVVEGIEMFAFGSGRFESLMHNVSKLLINTHYLHYKRRELLDAHRSVFAWVRYVCREVIVKVFSGRAWVHTVFRFVDSRGARNDIFSDILKKYSPNLIFSTDLFEQLGIQLIREAKNTHIPTIGMVRSWDNCLSKGLLRVFPDAYITNNTVIRDELVSLHGVAKESIEVVGLPQFDSFITKSPADRKTFFETHGLDPEKRLVMFAPAGTILSDTDADICEILKKDYDEKKLPQDIQFFVRNHPQHPADFSSFAHTQNLTIQSPGEKLDTKTHKETELTPADQDFLRNILAHTDVLIWVATTLCLDAVMYDVPEVVLNFDGYDTKREYYRSVKRYHNEDHMKKMFALKPFRVADTAEELIAYVGMYLNDRTIDANEREAVRKQQLYVWDGLSGKRVVDVLLKYITK